MRRSGPLHERTVARNAPETAADRVEGPAPFGQNGEMLQTTKARDGSADFDKFRLRNFAEHLVAIGEAEVHAKPIAMADLAAAIAETPKAVVFKDAGPEHFEIVAAAGGSRRRLAEALGVRRTRRRQGISQPARQAAADDRGRVGHRAGASGRAQGRRRRPHPPALPPAARARRRRLYLGVDRLCGRSRDRQAQCRLPPADAAQPRHHARQPDRRLRSQADVSRLSQARRAAAGELRDRLASARLSRRHAEAAGRRIRAGRHRARRAGADGARRHQRHLWCRPTPKR